MRYTNGSEIRSTTSLKTFSLTPSVPGDAYDIVFINVDITSSRFVEAKKKLIGLKYIFTFSLKLKVLLLTLFE